MKQVIKTNESVCRSNVSHNGIQMFICSSVFIFHVMLYDGCYCAMMANLALILVSSPAFQSS